MSRSNRQPKLAKRDSKIFKEFEKLFNVDGLRMDVIYTKLGEKYYLSSQTIQKIVLKQASSISKIL